jgi:hypothetical protein
MATNDANHNRRRQGEPDHDRETTAGFDGHETDVHALEDEVLVLDLDENGDGTVSGGVRGTYGGPPVDDHDEFSELGARWDGEELEQPRAPIGRRAWIAGAAGAGALVVVFALGGGDEASENGGDDVARRPAPARTERVANAEPVVVVDESEATDSAVSNDAGASDDAGSSNGTTASNEPANEELAYESEFGPDGAANETSARDSRAAFPRERREGTVSIEDQVVLPPPLANLQMVRANALYDVWTAEEPPVAGVAHASYVQTPFVGDVRVHTNVNEHFDGELIGLGAGRLVLGTEKGSLTLFAPQVRGLERIVEAGEGNGALVAGTTGRHVRVRAPGGWLRGEVVREQGDSITLLLDSGGRITVERRDLLSAESESTIRLAESLASR